MRLQRGSVPVRTGDTDRNHGAPVPGRDRLPGRTLRRLPSAGYVNGLHLARLVFGDAGSSSTQRVGEILDGWGYRSALSARHSLRGALGQVMLITASAARRSRQRRRHPVTGPSRHQPTPRPAAVRAATRGRLTGPLRSTDSLGTQPRTANRRRRRGVDRLGSRATRPQH